MVEILHIQGKNKKNSLTDFEKEYPQSEIAKTFFDSDFTVQLQDHQPDIVIIDRLDTCTQAVDVCNKIKSDALGCQIPVIVICEVISPELNQLAFKTQIESLLKYPVDKYQLLREIRNLKRMRSAELELLKQKTIVEKFVLENKAQLRETEMRFRTLINTIPYGISEYDLSGTITFSNKAHHEMLGYRSNELIGSKIWEQQYDKAVMQEKLSTFIDNQPTPEPYSIRFLTKDGEVKEFEFAWNYKRSNSGELLGFISIITDITEKKKVEEELKHEKELLQQMMDNIPDAIYFKDTVGRFIRINKQQARVLGVKSPKDAIGKTDFDYFNKEHAMMAYADEQTIIKTGVPLVDKVERLRQKNGQFIWVTASKISLRDKNGKVTGTVGISRNITDRIQAEKMLKQAKLKAEEADRLKTAFLANMSHEIRTPMTSIIGFSELLLEAGLSIKQQKKYLNYIRSSGKSLLNLINDIIDIAKIEAGQIKIKKSEFNINAIMGELFSTFKQEKQRKGKYNIELRINIPDSKEKYYIYSDPFRIKQVLSNLLSNAFKFIDKGFIEFGYTIEKNPDNGEKNKELILRFYVKDTGIGIPEDKMEVIFDRFGQIQETIYRNQGGTGLGLAISKKIVELLGGNIHLESTEGKGSTFYFTIPTKATCIEEKDEHPKKSKQIQTGKAPKKSSRQYSWENKVILVAEDEPMNFRLLDIVLRKTGAQILWVKDGYEAVHAAKTNKNIDAILMDLKMPQLDGYEAVEQIRKFNPVIPIIAQSAFALVGERDKCIAAGCNDYIAKPYKAQDVLEIINKYLSDND